MGACPFTVNESPAKLGSPGNDGICAPELAPRVESAGCRLTLLMLTGGNSVASQSEVRLLAPFCREKFTGFWLTLGLTGISVVEGSKPKCSARIKKRPLRGTVREKAPFAS